MTVQIFSWQNFQGVANGNLLNLRNLRLNLFRLLGLIRGLGFAAPSTETPNSKPFPTLVSSAPPVVKFLFSPLLLPPSLFAKKSREKSLFLLFRDQAEAEDAPIEFHLVLGELQKFSFTSNERMPVE